MLLQAGTDVNYLNTVCVRVRVGTWKRVYACVYVVHCVVYVFVCVYVRV